MAGIAASATSLQRHPTFAVELRPAHLPAAQTTGGLRQLPGLAVQRLRRRVAKSIAADPAWTRWWDHASLESLLLYPAPMGRGDYISFTERGQRLEVLASSADLVGRLNSTLPRDFRTSLLNVSGVADLLLELVLRMLHQTSAQLGLPEPPESLPTLRGPGRPHGGAARSEARTRAARPGEARPLN